MIRHATAIPAMVLALALSACAQAATPVQPGATPGGPPVTAAPTNPPKGPVSTPSALREGGSPLNNTEWTLRAVITPRKVSFTTEAGKAVIDISEGQIKGMTGCNTFLGNVRATAAGDWTVSSLQAGKQPCASAALASQNQAMLTILKSASKYSVAGSVLTLSAPEDQSALEFARA